MRFATLLLWALVSLSAQGQPIRHGVDILPADNVTVHGTAVDLVQLGDGSLALYTTGGGKYSTPEIFIRTFSNAGEPLEQSQRFIGTARVMAAGGSDRGALVVWASQDIHALPIGNDGLPEAAPSTIADHHGQGWSSPGVDSLKVISRPEGWLVVWSRWEYDEGFRSHVEAALVDASGTRIGDTFTIQSDIPSRQTLQDLLRTGTSTYVVAIADPSGVTLRRFDDHSESASATIPGARGATLAYSGSSIAVVAPVEDRLELHVFGERLSPGAAKVLTVSEWPHNWNRDAITSYGLIWDGAAWLAGWRKGYPPNAMQYLTRLTENGDQLTPALRASDDLHLPTLLSTTSGPMALITLPEGLHLTHMDGAETGAVTPVAERASNTSIRELVPLGGGRWFILYMAGESLYADVIMRSGMAPGGEPVKLADYTSVRTVVEQRGPTFFVATSTPDEMAIHELQVGRGDLAHVRTRVVDGLEGVIHDLAASPAGLIAYYTTGPQGAYLVHNIARLGDSLETVALRQLDESRVESITVTGTSIILGLAHEDFMIEVLDFALDTVMPRTVVIPSWSNPDGVHLSPAGDRILATWINDRDHLRTVVIDPAGNVIAGADGGIAVTEGGDVKRVMNVMPHGDGWLLSWVAQSEPDSCDAQYSVHRIEVDAEGRLLTPLPHEPAFVTPLQDECAYRTIPSDPTWGINRSGTAAWHSIPRFDMPSSGARRALVHFESTRARGARPGGG